MKDFTIINLTPHEIKLNNGTTFEPSGYVARAEVIQKDVSHFDFYPTGFEFNRTTFGNVITQNKLGQDYDYEKDNPNTFYIVSAIVLSKIEKDNGIFKDGYGFYKGKQILPKFRFISPNTSSTKVIRDDKGFIVSVPGFNVIYG